MLAAGHDAELARSVGIALGEEHTNPAGLTRREQDVLALVGDGATNREIAQRLVISESTVKVHVHRILKKLGARSRTEAVARAGRLDQDDA